MLSRRTRFRRPRGFSLVEMLVVVGIIILIAGISLPAIMQARKSARAAQCANNLRELGRLVHLYADQNQEYIPIGTSTVPHFDPPFVAGQKMIIPPTWRTDWNDFMSVRETPSAAMGALLINGMIDQGNASICFCPVEQRKLIRADRERPLFPQHGSTLIGGTIQISYAVRPEPDTWWMYRYDGVNIPPVTYPHVLAKLSQFVHQALISEPPERPPYNHGSAANPAINVCFADGSVRQIVVHEFKEFTPKPWFETVSEPYPTTVQNGSAMPVWQWLDQQ